MPLPAKRRDHKVKAPITFLRVHVSSFRQISQAASVRIDGDGLDDFLAIGSAMQTNQREHFRLLAFGKVGVIGQHPAPESNRIA